MDEIKVIKIFSAEDNLQAEMILGALKASHIPAFKRDAGGGGFLNLYGGNAVCGENIYVAENNVETAGEVLRDMGLELQHGTDESV